jgi:hypothetical protein
MACAAKLVRHSFRVKTHNSQWIVSGRAARVKGIYLYHALEDLLGTLSNTCEILLIVMRRLSNHCYMHRGSTKFRFAFFHLKSCVYSSIKICHNPDTTTQPVATPAHTQPLAPSRSESSNATPSLGCCVRNMCTKLRVTHTTATLQMHPSTNKIDLRSLVRMSQGQDSGFGSGCNERYPLFDSLTDTVSTYDQWNRTRSAARIRVEGPSLSVY